MIKFFLVEVLGNLGCDVFNISTTDGILKDKGMKDTEDLWGFLECRFKRKEKVDQIVKDGAVEFHDLFVSVGEYAGIEGVLGEDIGNGL